MTSKYRNIKESNQNINIQYERTAILNKYRTKLIQIRAKIIQLNAKAQELLISMQKELSDVNRDNQKQIANNLKNSTIPTTRQLSKRY